MDKISLVFLGTGNAIPTEKRNHTGILASFAQENILFDCGEGMQRQLRFAKISPTKITRIFITHWHGDHMLGLPGLFQTLAMSNYSKALHLYGPKGTRRFIQLIQELLMHININIQVHEISSPGTVLETSQFKINAGEMSHGTAALAYSLELKEKVHLKKPAIKKLKLPNSPLLGDLQRGKDIIWKGKKIKAKAVTYKEPGKKVTIVLDTSFNQEAIQLAEDSDLLIAEATFSSQDAEKAREYQHLTSSDAANIAKKSKSKKLIITHISQRYEHIPHIIEKEAKKIFKNTKIAKDLDKIII